MLEVKICSLFKEFFHLFQLYPILFFSISDLHMQKNYQKNPQILIDLKFSENILHIHFFVKSWQSFQQEGRRDYVYLSAFSKLTYPRFWNGNLKHFYGAQQRTTICFFHNLESSNRQNYGIPNKRILILKSWIIVENYNELLNWHNMCLTSHPRKYEL